MQKAEYRQRQKEESVNTDGGLWDGESASMEVVGLFLGKQPMRQRGMGVLFAYVCARASCLEDDDKKDRMRSCIPRIFQVPLSVLGVETGSDLSCAAISAADPTELLLRSAASSFLNCSIS
jgi:hypothetical protein